MAFCPSRPSWYSPVLNCPASPKLIRLRAQSTEILGFALLACDEITGLIIAATLVRPSRDIRELELKSVRNKWKDKRFAAGVDRDHVVAVTEDFSRACFDGRLELWQHIGNILTAMQGAAEQLELDGRLAHG